MFPSRRNHNHIWQVLMYARRVFYKIDTASALNPEAAVLYVPQCRLRQIRNHTQWSRLLVTLI